MTISSNLFEVFYACADADERFCHELDKHLGTLQQEQVITTWSKRRIVAGTDWAKALNHHLTKASIILLLISPDFFASSYSKSREWEG